MIVSPDAMRTDAEGRYHDDLDVRDRSLHAWEQCLRRATEAVLLVGAPGSGKSTWLDANEDPSKVYYDATLAHAPTRAQLIRMARDAGVGVVILRFRTPLEECVRRNAARERVTPEHTLRELYWLIENTPPKPSAGVIVREVA